MLSIRNATEGVLYRSSISAGLRVIMRKLGVARLRTHRPPQRIPPCPSFNERSFSFARLAVCCNRPSYCLSGGEARGLKRRALGLCRNLHEDARCRDQLLPVRPCQRKPHEARGGREDSESHVPCPASPATAAVCHQRSFQVRKQQGRLCQRLRDSAENRTTRSAQSTIQRRPGTLPCQCRSQRAVWCWWPTMAAAPWPVCPSGRTEV